MVVDLSIVMQIGLPVLTFAVTYGVMQYKISSLVKDLGFLERRTWAVVNFARWYLIEKEHMPLDRVNEILGENGE